MPWEFNATFNNISNIFWKSVLLMKGWENNTYGNAPTCHRSLTNFITSSV
jgi:hypothetical protein